MLDSALRYARRGWPAFPLRGKLPLTENGFKDATTDPDAVRTRWAEHPAANVGVRTGPDSGVFVLDLDGEDGLAAWAELLAEHGPVAATPTATTGGGGRHLFFKYPAGRAVRNRAKLTIGGTKRAVDIRGDGGYVVAAPSSHPSGNPYAWDVSPDDADPADAPDWLLDLLDPPRPPAPPPGPPRGPSGGDAALVARAAAYLDRMPAAVSGQGGHNAAYAAARAMTYGFDLGPEVAFALLAERYNPRCSPPWSERELEHKVRDADEKPFDHPRGYLRDAPPPGGPSVTFTPPGPSSPNAGPGCAPTPRPVLDAAAYHGPAGEYVRAVEPHTEADPAAVLVQLLVAFGNAAGRHRYVVADGARHHPNESALVVGATSKARKGTSWARVRPVLEAAAPAWLAGRVKSGLSSGEGVIFHVRDPAPAKPARGSGKPAEPDPGEPDKRLLCVESEFASVLDRAGRDGNSLSAVLRQCWDGGALGTLTKGDPTTATNAHVSVIGHVTAEELLKKLSDTDAANGFANRNLFAHAARAKLLPFGGDPPQDALDRAGAAFRAALAFAGAPGRVDFSADARPAWEALYRGPLAVERPGLVGKLLDRGPAHVLRVALIYALLDKSDALRPEHLRAAAAVWAYSEATVLHLFGQSRKEPVADRVRAALAAAGAAGLTRTELNDALSGHAAAADIGAALAAFEKAGCARQAKVPTKGRPAERWYWNAVPDAPGASSATSSAAPGEQSPSSDGAESAPNDGAKTPRNTAEEGCGVEEAPDPGTPLFRTSASSAAPGPKRFRSSDTPEEVR